VRRTGFDPDRARAREALDAGAIDRLVSNPRKDLQKADLVILSLPMFETREFMDVIADQLPEGIVILDASSIKAASFQWADELLPRSRHHIGIAPVVGYQALTSPGLHNLRPRPDLFSNGLLGIVAQPDTPQDAVALAINLAHLLGASPFFIGLHEHDAAMAAVEGLPLLLEAVLLRANRSSPSWRELDRTAGRVYASSTETIAMVGHKELGTWLNINREKLLDRLASVEAELSEARRVLEADSDEQAVQFIHDAIASRSGWLIHREKADWTEQVEAPYAKIEGTSWFGSLFGFRSQNRKR
jgi:prephenate dehydrogenase